MVCPVQAIFPEQGLGDALRPFATLNASLASTWPRAVFRGPLPDADQWASKKSKRTLLDAGTPEVRP
jgi:hypothetical protein